MNKSNMSFEVEFLAGTKLEDALDEAKEKAILWNLAYVTFDFNGVKVSCSKTFTTKYWVDEVLEAMSSEFKYVICSLPREKK